MKVGDRVTFAFGGKEKEGMVVKMFPKRVYLKVDFPRHPGKIVIRSLAELEAKSPTLKKKQKKEKPKKEKEPKPRSSKGGKRKEEKE